MEASEPISSEFFFLFGTSAMLVMALGVVFFIFLYQRKILRKNLENQNIKNLLQEQEMQTAYAMLNGQEKERKRIAGELHDNLGSLLTSLHILVDAELGKTNNGADKTILKKVLGKVEKASGENRKLSHELYSGMFRHFGLRAALDQLIESIQALGKMEVESVLNIQDVGQDVGLNCYRIVQELFNNTLKYSGASKVFLEINHFDDLITIIYEDNGKGFDFSEITEGIGLKNIRMRVQSMKGTVSFDAALGRGSAAAIEIPYTND